MVKMSYEVRKILGKPHRTIRVREGSPLLAIAGKHLFGTGKNYGRWEFTDNGDTERFYAFEREYLEVAE